MFLRQHILPAGIFLLLLLVPFSFLNEDKSGKLTVAFLNVGQGDAIFIKSPTGVQVLVDGGPDASVVRELGEVLSWRDRAMDLLIISNPDEDHIRGFLDILARFDVDAVMEPGTKKDTAVYKNLLKAMDEEGVEHLIARRGALFQLGGGARLEILFPDRNVSRADANTGSIVARLVYGDTEAFLPGDAPQSVENYVIELSRDISSDLLKVGHHGSRTSTGDDLLAVASPSVAIISAGKKNKYGHPHEEVLKRLSDAGIGTLLTAQEGTIIFESDGSKWQRVK